MTGERKIFQDVSDAASRAPKPTSGLIDAPNNGARRLIRWWLALLFLLVALMIVVGGLTRLTDSGLSITEWKPVSGALPPLSAADWQAEFSKYQASPEYQIQNHGMSLAAFKAIYWWEWGHRQLGRLIGLVWAVGFFTLLLARKIPSGWTGRLLTLGALGGLQGAFGWWMVASGLTGAVVDVASYRLAIHLGLAFVIMALILWNIFLLGPTARDLLQARRHGETRLARLAGGLGLLVFGQILLGALVAGIDAGRSYVDWPWMDGQFLPSESFDLTPLLSNFFENPALVQFDHRMIGYLVFLLAALVWWYSRKSAHTAVKRAFGWLMAMILLQMSLGIATVMNAAQAHIAITHQIGAIILIGLIVRARFVSKYPPQQSLR